MPQLIDALYAAGHKPPFDFRTERLIAFLRVALTLLCLITFATTPSLPREIGRIFELLLGIYALFGLVITLLHCIGKDWSGWQIPIHVIDVGVISLLIYFLPNLSFIFLTLFVFALLSATFRWNWRGALWTTVFLLAMQVVLLFKIASPIPFLFQSSFLCIIGGIFAFFGVSRERGVERLKQVAAWPHIRTTSYARDGDWLYASLTHIATVLQVPRVLVVWEIAQEPFTYTSLFAHGKVQQESTQADILDNLVSVELENLTFATDAIRSKECITVEGTKYVNAVVGDSFLARFKISSLCSTSFLGDNCKGRLFLLDRLDWSQDDLTMTEAVASRLRIEIEHYALSAVLEETVASRERIRLARDLHDGILQSLTAAALQLKTTASHSDEKVRGEIATVRNLLLSEQQRLRTFVDNRQALDTQQGIILYDEMQRQIEELEQQWGCRVVLQAIRPQNATVPLELTRQIRFLLAEAVANAVQHGNASRVNIAFERTPNDVQLLIRDNGQGLPGTNGNYSQTELANLGIGPQSIFKRITELRGTLSLSSSPKGVELCIGLACDEIAGSKTEYGAARAFR